MRGIFVTAVIVAIAWSGACAQQPPDADLIVAGRVYTMDSDLPEAQAVVIREGRIVHVGDVASARAWQGASTRWIEPRGAVVFPGLTDAHGHLHNLGRFLAHLKLVGTSSREEIASIVRSEQEGTPAGRWMIGRGWDQNDWEVQQFPTWRDLDGTEANPVYLRRIGGHAAWLNRTALDKCGITRDTPDPEGGRIIRDDAGEATGILIDTAMLLASEMIPEADEDELDEQMRRAIAHCNEVGLVGVHDARIEARHLESLERIARSGGLTLRIYCMLESRDEDLMDEHMQSGPGVRAGGYVTVGAVKLYADGAMGSRGAALIEPYDDDPGNSGLVRTAQEDMVALCVRALQNGFQVCAHAIGDRGNRMVLDAYEEALQKHPKADHRFRIEHCQLVTQTDLERFRPLGVIPSMQPTHATSDMYWAEERVGPERLSGAYAWRTLLDLGNRIAFGSDFPVESADPLWGIYAAVTRQDHKGWPEGGWYPVQRVSVVEALRGYTIDAAWARFAESQMGTITVGKVADLTVLDDDLSRVGPREMLKVDVLLTIVGGRVVYASEEVDG